MSIEYLKTIHTDNKIEKSKPLNPWFKRYLRFRFSSFGMLFPKSTTELGYKIFATPRSRAKHWKTDAVIDAAHIEDLMFEGLKIKTYSWGTGDKIILLVHGWLSRGTALRMFVNPLLKLGYKIIAFDAPAHGDSEGTQLNMVTNARVIAQIIEKNGGTLHGAIAHSFGCSSVIFTLQHINPSLVVHRVVLLAAPPRIAVILQGFMNSVAMTAKLRDYAIKKFLVINPHLQTFDTAHSESKVKIDKLLIVHDTQDYVTPISTAQDIEKNWKNAHLIITEGFGHYRLVKNPDVVRKITDFLA